MRSRRVVLRCSAFCFGLLAWGCSPAPPIAKRLASVPLGREIEISTLFPGAIELCIVSEDSVGDLTGQALSAVERVPHDFSSGEYFYVYVRYPHNVQADVLSSSNWLRDQPEGCYPSNYELVANPQTLKLSIEMP